MAFPQPTPLKGYMLNLRSEVEERLRGFLQDTIPAHQNYVPSSSHGRWTGLGQPTAVTVDILPRLQVNSQDDEEHQAQNK